MAASRRDGITGYVAGGLGNQLFILGAAWEQARRLGCPLYLDTSHHAIAGTRRFELDALETPARILEPAASWRALRLNTERVLPVPRRWGRVFLERRPDAYMPEIEQVRPGTTLLGYFQSGRYFPGVREELLGAIVSQPETDRERAIIAEMAAEPAVTLHLRRGDYLAVAEHRQFIATVAYAIRAIELLSRLGLGELPIRVFTDSVDLVRAELAAVPADVRLVEDAGALGNWATLKAMASGRAMIMSNSSFSWWAAALMRRADAGAPVIAPRPWTAGGTAKADLLEPDWLTLDAR